MSPQGSAFISGRDVICSTIYLWICYVPTPFLFFFPFPFLFFLFFFFFALSLPSLYFPFFLPSILFSSMPMLDNLTSIHDHFHPVMRIG